MIPDDIRNEIVRRMRAAEAEHDVKILLAVESGSRAWGFASPNSDYDARFIYVHRRDWYLSVGLEEQRDVIDYPIVDEVDLNGWDVRKALRLFSRSNPAFVEWIQSPIVYGEEGSFAAGVRALLPAVYSCEHGLYHYRSMAKTNYHGHLTSELVPLKKYFYVLRPLLSVRWIERYGTPAPIEFHKLLHLIAEQSSLVAEIVALRERKRLSPEMGREPQVPRIHRFIESELERLERSTPPQSTRVPVMETLNGLFRRTLDDSWGA